ncbi:hypothetical protein GOP47_0006024, partial [Adiantum capillus-veneris]
VVMPPYCWTNRSPSKQLPPTMHHFAHPLFTSWTTSKKPLRMHALVSSLVPTPSSLPQLLLSIWLEVLSSTCQQEDATALKAANNQTVVDSLPPPTFDIADLKASFRSQSLDIEDLVSLSGGHSIGKAHCRVVDVQRSPIISQDLDPEYVDKLTMVCLPIGDADRESRTVGLDIVTQEQFDNAYFRNVLDRRATFHSDAALLNDPDSAQLVHDYAEDQQKFFDQFTQSMIKMSKLRVLTGNQGVIRKKCFSPN